MKKLWGIIHMSLLVVWEQFLVILKFLKRHRLTFYMSMITLLFGWYFTKVKYDVIIIDKDETIAQQEKMLIDQTKSLDLMESAFASAVVNGNKSDPILDEFDLNKVPVGVILWRSGDPEALDSTKFVDTNPREYYESYIVSIYNKDYNKVYKVGVPYYAMSMFNGKFFKYGYSKSKLKEEPDNKEKKESEQNS